MFDSNFWNISVPNFSIKAHYKKKYYFDEGGGAKVLWLETYITSVYLIKINNNKYKL